MTDAINTALQARHNWLWRIRSHPSAVLLLVQLLGVLLYPFIPNTEGGGALWNWFGLVVLAAALRMVRKSPAETWIGVALALPVAALLIAHQFWPTTALVLWTSALEAAFYLYATYGLISYMLADDHASADELFAAGATFTLMAWAFAHLLTLCQAFFPGSFAADPALQRTWMDLLFLSFTTLSGVGLGDIVPLTPMAKALVMLGEFAGVMFLALVVSRLISLTRRPS